MTKDDIEKIQELRNGLMETWERFNSKMRASKKWSKDLEQRITSNKEVELELAVLWGESKGISAALGQIEKLLEEISVKK